MTEISPFCGRKLAVFVHEKISAIRITGVLRLLKHPQEGNSLKWCN